MTDDIFYHLGFGKSSIKEQNLDSCIISGDPERAEVIATNHLKEARCISSHRGLKFFVGKTASGKHIISGTSGMGAPSLSIVVSELFMLGIRNFIRVGTSGSIQRHVKAGDLVVSQASLCAQGTANDIAPISFPAAADPELSLALFRSAQELKFKTHIGVTASVDSFYEGQERYDGAKKKLLRKNIGLMEEYRELGILNFEMESGTLFKMGLVYGFKAACICAVVAERAQSEKVDQSKISEAVDHAIKVAVNCL
jgi:uridine phosphorylase